MDNLTLEIAGELTIDMIPDGIWKAVAQEIGTINLIKVLQIINGDDIYIPKPDRLLIPARNKIILKEFTGYNHKYLAMKYGVTVSYIKKICKSPPISRSRDSP